MVLVDDSLCFALNNDCNIKYFLEARILLKTAPTDYKHIQNKILWPHLRNYCWEFSGNECFCVKRGVACKDDI